MSDVKTGVELIAAERQRQIEVEGWTAEDDATHDAGQLAMAAACYAAPIKIYAPVNYANSILYADPWPFEYQWDKRFGYGHDEGNVLPDPTTYSSDERIDLLVKAGALIAAEIDRLNSLTP
jgi:hypothetical protein